LNDLKGIARATLSFQDLKRNEVLDKDEVVLGRGLDVDLHIADRRVGRRHAAFKRMEDGRYKLVDLGSYNGTYVGGERVTERILEPGDEIWIGGTDAVRFTFQLDSEAEAEAEAEDAAAVPNIAQLGRDGPAQLGPPKAPSKPPQPRLRTRSEVRKNLSVESSGDDHEGSSTQYFPSAAVPTLRGSPESGRKAEEQPDRSLQTMPLDDLSKTAFIGTASVRRRHVQFMVEGFVVKNIELTADQPITIGRDRASNTVHLDHPSVSVQHAVIDAKGVLPVVVDKGSTNGTFVNGRRLKAEEACPLKEGDTITFGIYKSRSLIFRDSAREEIEVESASMQAGRMAIGRDPDNELHLDHVLVSRRHALLEETADGSYRVRDEGSQNGTFLNGRRLNSNEWMPLDDGDRIQIGPFVMNFTQGEVKAGRDSSAIRIDCRGLGRTVQGDMGPLSVLQGITLTIERRDLVGIIGPSGSGKTTFLTAISGLSGFSTGEVRYNGLSLKQRQKDIRPFVGYVPQHDKLHLGLTVRETLSFAAEMRLPKDTQAFDRANRVEQVVESIDLKDRIDTKVGELSGGQRKRVSIGLELLAQPGVLYLDEPTAGLDPRTTERMMYLFRKIASGGTTVVLTTHLLGSFELFDKVIVLNRGRLAYCGPGTQFFGYFDVNSPAEVYAKIEGEETPEAWEQRFRSSEWYSGTPGENDPAELGPPLEASSLPPVPKVRGIFGQLSTLTRRALSVKVSDRGGFITLLLQAPVVAALVLAIAGGLPNGPPTLFLMAIAALWFGCANSVREIVDEGEIYKRERLSVLKRTPFLGSKLTVLTGIGVVQSLLFTGVLTVGGALQGHFIEATAIMVLLYFNGVAMGLVVSGLARSPTTALGAIPLLMIPQILFAGLLTPIGDLPTLVPATSQEIIDQGRVEGEKLVELREALGETVASGVAAYEVDEEGSEELARFTPVTAASEPVTLISTVMSARWGLEALAQLYVHDPFELGVDSSKRIYQYKLANAIFLSLYDAGEREAVHQRLMDGQGEAITAESGRIGQYMLILLVFGVLTSMLVLLALVRRDGYEFR
jgi:ABC-type multidrug transport system ATPase subunit/pSer/pThr/pTyr-binding forkhead associated (FHA) protein